MKSMIEIHFSIAKQVTLSKGDEISISKGMPLPFGAVRQRDRVNFALYAKSASDVILALFEPKNPTPLLEIHLDACHNRTGNVWHIALENLQKGLLYAYRLRTPHEGEHSPNFLLDPYAKATTQRSVEVFADHHNQIPFIYNPLGIIDLPEVAGWESDSHPRHAYADLLIYEAHVRGMTQDPTSRAKYPGTYLGVIDSIPHLKQLGINAIELLPVFEFNAFESQRCVLPHYGSLGNYWGYNPVNFFSPMNRYATTNDPGQAVSEFKQMVMALHREGIEVLLDIVLNHTGEGNERGPNISFKGIEPSTYYILDSKGRHTNYTGCGNTFNCNHPISREIIIDLLRYWVVEMHVDGFRFDLASILTRDRHGNPMPHAPIVETIAEDPVLANTKLIAEPWDAAGLYQVGHFYPDSRRYSEWNGKYRDAARDFIKGTPGKTGEFATRICGSQDLYGRGSPLMSVNFITAHDGFTLRDLVSYNTKHNLNNGENNRDGSNDNRSWNCGMEGKTDDPDILILREKQMRNLHLALMLSQGVPMVQMGDEYGHTKEGNNNTWCQDNALNWFQWDQLEQNKEFFRFFRLVNQLRKNEPLLRRGHFLSSRDIDWHGVKPHHPNWSFWSHFVACTWMDHLHGEHLYAAFNASGDSVVCTLPKTESEKQWHWIVDTAKPSPEDILEKYMAVNDDEVKIEPYASIVLKAL